MLSVRLVFNSRRPKGGETEVMMVEKNAALNLNANLMFASTYRRCPQRAKLNHVRDLLTFCVAHYKADRCSSSSH